VVKSLNTVNTTVMVEPNKLAERTDIFVSGNDLEAKKAVTKLLHEIGWISVIDLGDITTSRSVEMYIMLWRSFRHVVDSYRFNIKLVSH